MELEKTKGEDLINAYKFLKGGCQEGGARLFSVLPTDRKIGSGHELEDKKFCMHVRNNFFTATVTEHWHRLLRDVVESASMEILRTHLDAFLCNLFYGTCINRVWWTGGSPEVPSSPYSSVIL